MWLFQPPNFTRGDNMPFLTEAILKPYGGDKWRLVEDFDYATIDGQFIRIQHGFICDLASIPRPIRLAIPVNGRHRQAAIVHDWLYNRGGLINEMKRISRKECDLIFLEAMTETGVSYFKRWAMYYGVRMGGSFSFQR